MDTVPDRVYYERHPSSSGTAAHRRVALYSPESGLLHMMAFELDDEDISKLTKESLADRMAEVMAQALRRGFMWGALASQLVPLGQIDPDLESELQTEYIRRISADRATISKAHADNDEKYLAQCRSELGDAFSRIVISEKTQPGPGQVPSF